MGHSNINGAFVNQTFKQSYCKAKLKQRKYEKKYPLSMGGESQGKKMTNYDIGGKIINIMCDVTQKLILCLIIFFRPD